MSFDLDMEFAEISNGLKSFNMRERFERKVAIIVDQPLSGCGVDIIKFLTLIRLDTGRIPPRIWFNEPSSLVAIKVLGFMNDAKMLNICNIYVCTSNVPLADACKYVMT